MSWKPGFPWPPDWPLRDSLEKRSRHLWLIAQVAEAYGQTHCVYVGFESSSSAPMLLADVPALGGPATIGDWMMPRYGQGPTGRLVGVTPYA